MATKIIVAVDGSMHSFKAYEHALGLAKAHGAELFIVNAIADPRTGKRVEYGRKYGSIAVVRSYVQAARKEVVHWMAPLEEKAIRNGVEKSNEILWELGKSAVELITEYAKKNAIDLIVVGTRGVSGFKRLLLGSDATSVVSHVPCPVLVVR